MAEAEPHYFRIQRDTRFAKDKAPYKTNVAADLAVRAPRDGEDGHGIPGWYVSFGLDGEYMGVGTWHMSPEVLTRYRTLLDQPRTGAQIQTMVDQLLEQGCTTTAMEKLKRVPPPYAQHHPRAELLKHKGLAIVAQPKDDISGSRQMLDWAEGQLRAAAPLTLLLDKALSSRS
jgi:uncharacterized protein (TIGR02453 family)